MIRVCIVEDQTLVRKGFRSLLELTQDMKMVVAEAHDGEEVLLAIPKAKPDVVLLDVQLPKRNRIELLRKLGWVSGVDYGEPSCRRLRSLGTSKPTTTLPSITVTGVVR